MVAALTSAPRFLFWEGHFLAEHSMARVNRGVVGALRARSDVDLTIVPLEAGWPGRPDLEALSAAHVRTRGLDPRKWNGVRPLWVRHTFPPVSRRPPRVRLVQMMPWEYSLLPLAYAESLNAADEVWTTSEYSRVAMLQSGVAPERLHVLGNGFDPAVFHPEGPREPVGEDGVTLFLYVGGTIYRKGADVIVRAFLDAFRGRRDVALVIKDHCSRDIYKGATIGDWIREVASQPDAPPILYVDEEWSEERLAGLYRAADALVAPYRGEGFHLGSLEAMACGIPVLVTAGGATDDFVDESVGWRIPARRKAVGRSIFGLDTGSEAFLHEPEHDALVNLLRAVASAPDERKRRGAQGRERAADAWTWGHIAERVAARLATQ